MGMKPFKTAGGYRGKETKMRCVYVYINRCMCVCVYACALTKREKNIQGRVGEGNALNARKEIFDQSCTCELTLRNSAKICRERGFLQDG